MLKFLSKSYQTRRTHKYNAKRVDIEGETYRSGLEAEVHAYLKLLERAGEIKNIRREVPIRLTPSVSHKLDYVVFDVKRGIDIGIECKGFEEGQWLVKKNLYKDFGPFPLQIWMKKGGKVFIFKEIPAGKYEIKER